MRVHYLALLLDGPYLVNYGGENIHFLLIEVLLVHFCRWLTYMSLSNENHSRQT